MRLLVLGLGYSASRLVELHGGSFETVVGTRREPGAAPVPGDAKLLAFDGLAASPALREATLRATHILVSIAPGRDGDPVIAALGGAIAEATSLAWIGYLSTVGVYGDFGGAWIDETTALRPSRDRNLRRVEAERRWLDLGQHLGLPVQIFRLAGIYGPGRSAIDNLRDGSARRVVKPGQVFNRIHVDDIAGAVMAGLARPGEGPVVNVADDEPAPPQDVIAYAAGLLGVEPPPEIPFEAAEMTPMGRSFYSESKRVSNRLLRERLGYNLLYPTYREGLAALAAS
jgi:nucleoside-diphosphate-sugar epimerase